MLPFSPTKRYVENGYDFNETSLEWEEACRNLPCFSAVWWPDYSTRFFSELQSQVQNQRKDIRVDISRRC